MPNQEPKDSSILYHENPEVLRVVHSNPNIQKEDELEAKKKRRRRRKFRKVKNKKNAHEAKTSQTSKAPSSTITGPANSNLISSPSVWHGVNLKVEGRRRKEKKREKRSPKNNKGTGGRVPGVSLSLEMAGA